MVLKSNMLKFKIAFFFSFLVSISLYAQDTFSVSGTIKNVENGETLLGANVYLKGTTNGTITNEYGFFSITAAKGNYSLVVSYIGYQNKIIEIALNKICL